MDPDVDIKQVTGFKTPKQYGCIKGMETAINFQNDFSDSTV